MKTRTITRYEGYFKIKKYSYRGKAKADQIKRASWYTMKALGCLLGDRCFFAIYVKKTPSSLRCQGSYILTGFPTK